MAVVEIVKVEEAVDPFLVFFLQRAISADILDKKIDRRIVIVAYLAESVALIVEIALGVYVRAREELLVVIAELFGAYWSPLYLGVLIMLQLRQI